MKRYFYLFFVFALFTSPVLAFEKLWYLTDTPRSIESFQKNYFKIDVVGPQTYFLKKNGVVEGKVPDTVQDIANRNGVKVMPLLANIGSRGFDQNIADDLLKNKENWEKVSKFLREESVNKGYIGFQLDLENIEAGLRPDLNNFVKYLHTEMQKDNLKLSIAVVGKISDSEKDFEKMSIKNYWKNWAGVYDYKTLGENTDFVSVMAYDEPDTKGPVATIIWSQRVFEFANRNISPDKISFGIPVYGAAYRKGEKKRFTMVGYPFVYKIRNNFNKNDLKNMTTGEGVSKGYGNVSWVSYNKSGKNYTIWYEDVDSYKMKMDYAKDKNVYGASMWVLGDEDPKIWKLF